jgi:hypothetical protein
MSSRARLSLLIAVVAAGLMASAALAKTSPWYVVAWSHKPAGANGTPRIHVNLHVGARAGHRYPEALAVRVRARHGERYVPAQVGIVVTCGGYRHNSTFRAKTPVTRAIAFRTWRARSCTLDLGAYSDRGSDELTLHLLCRARVRSDCAPFEFQ